MKYITFDGPVLTATMTRSGELSLVVAEYGAVARVRIHADDLPEFMQRLTRLTDPAIPTLRGIFNDLPND